jgi:hypothetical protein
VYWTRAGLHVALACTCGDGMPIAVAETTTAAVDATTKATLTLTQFTYTPALGLVPTMNRAT